MIDINKNNVREIAQNIQEEHTEAVKSLLEIAGMEIEGEEGTDLAKVKAEFQDKGYRIHTFQSDMLEHIFILALNGEYVAGSIVSTNFELGTIKRTMIPHDPKIEEQYNRWLKGGK
jgi:hypothetical protein